MKKLKLTAASALILIAVPFAQAQELPFQLIQGNRVVIQGTVAGDHKLAMLVDTGASWTVIDKRTAKRLRLEFLSRTLEYGVLGKVERAPLAVVRDLRVGAISASFSCIVADIPDEGVDMILGLNILRNHNFAIDYEQRKLVFNPAEMPSESIAFESETMVVVIRARVRGETIRMLVDTGAANHCVFRGGPVLWLPKNEGQRITTRHLGGGSQSGEVSLRTLSIGSNEWKELKAMAISNPKPDSWDSILSVGSLGLKRIYFDFEHGFLSWAR